MKNRRNILIIVLVIIIISLFRIVVNLKSSYNEINNIQSNNSDAFEKKKKCVEMRKSYEEYLNKTWVIEDSWDWYYQILWDFDIFYNSERDSCLGAFWTSSNMYSEPKTMRFAIYDYLNWNEELFSCVEKADNDCMNEWNNKKKDLWEYTLNNWNHITSTIRMKRRSYYIPIVIICEIFI